MRMLLAAILALHVQPVVPNVPNKQPQLAASGATVAMVFASGDSIYLTKSADSGRSFGAPSKIAVLPKLLAGRHRGPRIVITGNTMLVTAIASGTDLVAWRSTDAGRTWSKPAVVNDVPTAAREGLDAIAADAQGHIAAAWLDDRLPGGKRLWGAFSDDAGATWSKNVQLYDGTICECCHPSLLAIGNNDFVVMWRNKVDGSRDLYTMRLRNGKPATPAAKQGTGTWKLEACPMDGGGLAYRNGDIVTAWRRDHDIYLAHHAQETKLGPGMDVALAVNAKGEYAAWTNGKGIDALLPGATTPTRLSESGAFPTLLTLPDGTVLAAWEQEGTIATKRLE
jgi:hypothetical protein